MELVKQYVDSSKPRSVFKLPVYHHHPNHTFMDVLLTVGERVIATRALQLTREQTQDTIYRYNPYSRDYGMNIPSNPIQQTIKMTIPRGEEESAFLVEWIQTNAIVTLKTVQFKEEVSLVTYGINEHTLELEFMTR